jgi:feruloyl esterase
MFAFGTNFFRNMVYSDPNWQQQTFDPDRDPTVASHRLSSTLDSINPDLSVFQKRGGKLIVYHGWSDPAIPSANAIRYYDSVDKKMSAKAAAEFVRLYMVPRTGDCGGGASQRVRQAATPDADRFHSADAALEAWVEQGSAPAEIIATKYKDSKPCAPVERTRPICPWPQTAHYKGTGSTDDASRFSCAK